MSHTRSRRLGAVTMGPQAAPNPGPLRGPILAALLAVIAASTLPTTSLAQPEPAREHAGMVLPKDEPYGTDHSFRGTLRGYHTRFQRVNPHKQFGWITTYSLVLLLLFFLLGGYSLRLFGKAVLPTIPASALITLTPLAPWFRLHPLLYVAGVFFLMTLLVRALSGPEKHQEFRQLARASLIVVALAWLPTNAARALVRLIFDVPAEGATLVSPAGPARIAITLALLATALSAFFVGLAALRFEHLNRAGWARFGRPLCAVWMGTLAVGIPLALFAERIPDWRLRVDAEGRWLEGFRFGPEIVMLLFTVIPLLAAIAMFRGDADRPRLVRYGKGVAVLYAIAALAWGLAR